jgi:hypothetical protein
MASSEPTLPCRFGDFVLERVVGRGGMGVVYQGRQIHLDRLVAVKMIRSGCLASDDEVARFYAEARSAARLQHPNIVTVYQCGEADGHHYFSMDYVPGTDLAKKLEKGPLPPTLAARYVRDVARAIQFAHEKGILHRDLKPANVLIDENDQVVVSDFGLAKIMGTDAGLTRSGAALGTPSYMSPEQASGKSDEHGTGTDVYSIGAVLFALLAGKPPFQGETPLQTMLQVIHRPAQPLRQLRRDLHRDLETIVNKCLQKQPQRRYPSAMAVAEDLDRFLSGRPVLARPMSKPRKLWYWFQGVPLVSALTGYRHMETTTHHRWVQRLLLVGVMLVPIAYFSYRSYQQWQAIHAMPDSVMIASGDPHGSYHEVASLLAENLHRETDRPLTVLATEGSQDNLDRLLRGQVQLGLLQSNAVRHVQIAVVAPLYYEAVHLLVHRDCTLSGLGDLADKRVAMGTPHSGTRQASLLLLSKVGLTERDIHVIDVQQGGISSVENLDAAVVVVKPGQAWIDQLLSDGQFRLQDIPEAVAISLEEPTFRNIQLTSQDYPHAKLTKPVSTLATTAFLASRIDAPPKLIRITLDSLYSKDQPISGILTAAKASHWQGLPWHPVARDFFDRLYEAER